VASGLAAPGELPPSSLQKALDLLILFNISVLDLKQVSMTIREYLRTSIDDHQGRVACPWHGGVPRSGKEGMDEDLKRSWVPLLETLLMGVTIIIALAAATAGVIIWVAYY
jgi:hypothetical protein